MSDMSVQVTFTVLFKRRLKGLAKKYRQIKPIFSQSLMSLSKETS
ncbi:hypothetical protein QUA72_19970 [Microcoleus sp. M2_B4]